MSYNIEELPKYINTAGKISVVAALFSVVIFAIAFLLNIGAQELQRVDAQGVATTSVTVLNTPPQWTSNARESTASATTTPTNSGDLVTWIATATDSNAEDYYLLICSTDTAPTSTPGGAPSCNGGIQWAVSGPTLSGQMATAATTTTESPLFFPGETKEWYAWICDSVNPGARCNTTYTGHDGTATSSPFQVNRRPSFTAFSDTSPGDPGATITFYATTSDADVVATADTMQLHVCSTASFSTSTNSCTATTLATSTFGASPLSASYTIFTPTPDGTYGAYGYVIDEHGHEASGGEQGQNTVLAVNNVAPTVLGGDIILNGGGPLILTQEAGETTGFTLDFTINDNNSCETQAAANEITGFEVAVFRSGLGTTTPTGCDTTGDNYDPNNCYDTGVATATWDLDCTIVPGSCTYDGVVDFDDDVDYQCTFPLWYVADPTNGTSTQTFYFDESWSAGVAGADNNFATGSIATTSSSQELNAFLSFSLDTLAIPYGPLEPGQRTDPLVASTTLRATGNIGLDQSLSGEHMCDYYTTAVTCLSSATSTIASDYQVFATSTVTYATATGTGNTVSSTTVKQLELNILKATSTATGTTGTTYWGIEVPGSITRAGIYTGENTIWGVSGEPERWYQ